MTIKTDDYIDIYCLPDYAKCMLAGISPEKLDYCPARKFDYYGMMCLPNQCEHYTEEEHTNNE